MDPARRRALLGMRDDLFRLLQTMTDRVRADAATLEVDADDYLGRVWTDVETFAARTGLTGSDPPPPPAVPEPPEEVAPLTPEPSPPSASFAISIPECFGCLLTLLCGRRLAAA